VRQHLTSVRGLAVVAVSVLLVSCSSESLTAPQPAPAIVAPTEASASLGSVLGGIIKKNRDALADGVVRLNPMTENVTVTQTIGAAGGTLSIPEAGVTVTVPAGAIPFATEISITARKGSLLAYDFKPHGLTFAKPLVITQKLEGTNATVFLGALLQLGYYDDPAKLTNTGATVAELIAGIHNAMNRTFSASIPHFSGYMISMGRSAQIAPPTVDGW
jgi:hypothetical protein